MSTKQALSTAMVRSLVCVTAVGAAIIHAATAASTTTGGVAAVLALVSAAELTIAVGVAIAARWLTAPRIIAGLVLPVVMWATLLLVAVTAKAPELTSALATLPMGAASLLALAGIAIVGADARRSRMGGRVRAAHPVAAVAMASLLTALVVTPSVASTVPARVDTPSVAEQPPDPAPRIVFGDHADH